MLSMSRKAMILMVLMLAAATAATAATAFAGSKKRPDVAQQVVEAIQISSDAAARAKLQAFKPYRLADVSPVKAPVRR